MRSVKISKSLLVIELDTGRMKVNSVVAVVFT